MGELQVLMASWHDEDDLVAEIWRGDNDVCDVRRRDVRLLVSLNPAGGRVDDLEIDELVEALTRGRARLQREP